eukprot:scaffold249235_cov18-Tisochrysis_lutea.AAC.1
MRLDEKPLCDGASSQEQLRQSMHACLLAGNHSLLLMRLVLINYSPCLLMHNVATHMLGPQDGGEAAGGEGGNEQPPPEGDADELELGLDLAKKKKKKKKVGTVFKKRRERGLRRVT